MPTGRIAARTAVTNTTPTLKTQVREPMFCPSHDKGLIRRGTNQCPVGKKRRVQCMVRICRKVGGGTTILNGESVQIRIPPEKLSPMRRKNDATKRSKRRWQKGYEN